VESACSGECEANSSPASSELPLSQNSPKKKDKKKCAAVKRSRSADARRAAVPASGCSLTYTARELVDAGYTVDNGGGHAGEQREREVLALKQEVASVKSRLDKESADTLLVGNRLKACVCVCVCVCVYAWSPVKAVDDIRA
jgi:hypothetical protein